MLNLGVREHFLNHVAELCECVVQPGVAQVEDLAADDRKRSIQGADKAGSHIMHVDKRTPLLTVENGDDPFIVSLGHQQIDYQVEARTIGQTEYGGETKNGRVKSLGARVQQS